MSKRQRKSGPGDSFLAALSFAEESTDRARVARERLIERTKAEPERVLEWLSRQRPGVEEESPLLRNLRAIATIAVLDKMFSNPQSSPEDGKGQ